MKTPIDVLLIEDSEDDALLLVHELRRGGYAPRVIRVETLAELYGALADRSWDLIIADHSLPHLNSTAALMAVESRGLDLPFIIVSGSIRHSTAITAMKVGACAYIPKHDLSRLVPTVRRELHARQFGPQCE